MSSTLGLASGSPSVLLLHGGGPGVDATQNWAGVMPRLRSRFDCVAPDLAGFGTALDPEAAPLHGPSAWAQARVSQVLDLIERRGLAPVDVVGNSAGGGAAALRAMATRPEAFRRAVLMGGAGTGGLPARVPYYGSPSRESMRATLAQLMADPVGSRDVLDEMVGPRFEAASRPGAERAFRSMFEPDPPGAAWDADLSAITCPVLLLHGAEDKVTPVAVSERLAERLPHARVVVVPGAGHWIHVDQPAMFCQQIEDFFSEETQGE